MCPSDYFDSCVTDPPYGWKFMGKKWDYEIPKVDLWEEVYRCMKPGAFILVACGTRTQHRMAVNVEDAGFEIRDIITWHYGSGFPKSLNIGKAIDKLQGNERIIIETGNTIPDIRSNNYKNSHDKEKLKETASKGTSKWEGWGTSLKPATELWTLARKPLEGTVANNVLKYGVGGLNIDGCRIESGTEHFQGKVGAKVTESEWRNNSGFNKPFIANDNPLGRFPANVIFDEFTGALLDQQSGILKSGDSKGFKGESSGYLYGKYANNQIDPNTIYADSGGASRFFYCAKASGSERDKGLNDIDLFTQKDSSITKNNHATVKPILLMRYLVKLITPANGLCVDPFSGSGSTGIACKLEGFDYIGIEMDKHFCEVSEKRIKAYG